MERLSLSLRLFRAITFVLAVVLFGTGCQKSKDDHACPRTSSPAGTARSAANDGTKGVPTTGVPGSAQYNGGSVGNSSGSDDSGISDDGDDEADGERSRKPRTGGN